MKKIVYFLEGVWAILFYSEARFSAWQAFHNYYKKYAEMSAEEIKKIIEEKLNEEMRLFPIISGPTSQVKIEAVNFRNQVVGGILPSMHSVIVRGNLTRKIGNKEESYIRIDWRWGGEPIRPAKKIVYQIASI